MINLPEAPADRQLYVDNLRQEIMQLKTLKERRVEMAAQAKRDEEFAKQLEQSGPSVVAPSQAAPLPRNANPNVVKLIEKIKECYNDDIDYDTASLINGEVENNLGMGVDYYANNLRVEITFTSGAKSMVQQFGRTTKLQEVVEFAAEWLHCSRAKVHLRKNISGAPPLNTPANINKTLLELAFDTHTALVVEVL
jgi:hypothetical protein